MRHCCTISLALIQDTTFPSISVTYISTMNTSSHWWKSLFHFFLNWSCSWLWFSASHLTFHFCFFLQTVAFVAFIKVCCCCSFTYIVTEFAVSMFHLHYYWKWYILFFFSLNFCRENWRKVSMATCLLFFHSWYFLWFLESYFSFSRKQIWSIWYSFYLLIPFR